MEIEEFRNVVVGDWVRTNLGGIGVVTEKYEKQCKIAEWKRDISDCSRDILNCSVHYMTQIVEVVKKAYE